jgi:hypothetical protein
VIKMVERYDELKTSAVENPVIVEKYYTREKAVAILVDSLTRLVRGKKN